MKPKAPAPDRVLAFVELMRERAHGRARALRARDLAELGYSDRECRLLAHAANLAGFLVVADNAGYYWPAEYIEVEQAKDRLRSQGRQMIARADQLERSALDYFATRKGMLF